MSHTTRELKYHLNRALQELPEESYIFSRDEVEKIVDAVGGWVNLLEIIKRPTPPRIRGAIAIAGEEALARK